MKKTLQELVASRPLNLAILFGLVCIYFALPVPGLTEEHYFIPLIRELNHDFLKNDWTFSTTFPDRWTFDAIFALPAALLPLPVLGWSGRILCWMLILTALYRLGSRLKVPTPLVTMAVLLWIVFGQSLFGGEMMLGMFEAKSLAYGLLLHGIIEIIDQRWNRAAILWGLTVTIHPAIGMVAMAAMAAAMFALGLFKREMARPAIFGLLVAAPGLVQALLMMAASGPASNADWQFVGATFMKLHFDPTEFTRGQVLVTIMAFAFILVWARRNRSNSALALVATFLAFLFVPVIVGFLAFFIGEYRVMVITPFRLFPVFALLLFFMSVASAVASPAGRRPGPWLSAFLVVTLLGFPSMFRAFRTHRSNLEHVWARRDDDMSRSFDWINDHVPKGAVGIMPPWRGDAAFRARRAEVVQWAMPRYDHLSEWRKRAEALMGGVPRWVIDRRVRDTGVVWKIMKDRYYSLRPLEVLSIARKYGASFFVTDRDYPFPLMFRQGKGRVYDVGSRIGNTAISQDRGLSLLQSIPDRG
ncbi:MAG: hypothetical protein GXP54_07885 [Deltaproteobacteria bacterium]|nr:hypothetical protein [Deltaproteobacteria bacterium]